MSLGSHRAVVFTVTGIVAIGLWTAGTLARQRAAAVMTTAATAYVNSLTPEQKQQGVFAMPDRACLDAEASECEWTRWAFIPASMSPRNGVPLKDMTAEQRQRAHDLMKASLSQAGYTTATTIMSLESVLRVTENADETGRSGGQPVGQFAVTPPTPTLGTACGLGDMGAVVPAPGVATPGRRGGGARRGGQAGGRGRAAGGGNRAGGGGAPIIRDPDLYYFSVFGEPSTTTAWGWRVEGHHVSFRFAVDGAKMTVAATPNFLGANPARVPDGAPNPGLRALALQEDTARALMHSLTPAQCSVALVSGTPVGDIGSGTRLKVDPANPLGLAATEMTPAQRDLLTKLLESYTNVMAADIAADRMSKITAAGIDKIAFAWSGSSEPRQPYFYQVQGPTFVLEHNNTQNNGNHIHSVWRDYNGDFGRDLLGEHLAAVAH
jgi:uncharacterized membrane protein YgcG